MIEHTIPIHADIALRLAEGGSGRPILLLHGGGGPRTVTGIAQHLEASHHVLMSTHPGWNGTPRPDWLDSIDELAMLYLRLLAQRGLRDVVVIGSSVGGWIAAQMAVRDVTGLVGRIALIDAVGIDVPTHPMPDFFGLTPRGIAEHSYHDPDRFFVDPTTLSAEAVAQQRANMATLCLLAADPYMHDPKLLPRLGGVSIPALLIWGDADRIVTPAYGAAYAAAFPHGRFELVERAGHLPQLERPDAVNVLLDTFARPAP
jgi:pimeloyl-ACP methyl ester carboxylesterase